MSGNWSPEDLAAYYERQRRGGKVVTEPPGPAKKSKYRNIKTVIDGLTFASKREARRYADLKLLERAGKISELFLQVKLPISIDNQHVCNYIADFIYQENGKRIVEDCKGYRTSIYRLKKKLVRAVYKVEIRET